MARHLRVDENYQRVLRAAAGLIAERGYLGSSVNDLIERAGLTKNAFYSHFPSKEALAVAVVDQTAQQWPPLIAAFKSLRAPALDTAIALTFEVAHRCVNDDLVRAGLRLSLERDTIKTPVPPPFDGWAEEIEKLLSPAGDWELMGLAVPGRRRRPGHRHVPRWRTPTLEPVRQLRSERQRRGSRAPARGGVDHHPARPATDPRPDRPDRGRSGTARPGAGGCRDDGGDDDRCCRCCSAEHPTNPGYCAATAARAPAAPAAQSRTLARTRTRPSRPGMCPGRTR